MRFILILRIFNENGSGQGDQGQICPWNQPSVRKAMLVFQGTLEINHMFQPSCEDWLFVN